MKKVYSVILSFAALAVLSASPVNADVSCQPIYGGGETCVVTTANLAINKVVQNPGNNAFVDNLSINDPKFRPLQNVTFQVTVTNTGDANIPNINVKDVFPQFTDFATGPGNFDAGSKTLSFDLSNLAAGESRTFTIIGRVVAADALPKDKGVVCVVNQVSASASNIGTASDNSQFCIEKEGKPAAAPSAPGVTKGGLPVKQAPPMKEAPPTGPEMFSLIGLLPMGAAGYFLRRKSTIK